MNTNVCVLSARHTRVFKVKEAVCMLVFLCGSLIAYLFSYYKQFETGKTFWMLHIVTHPKTKKRIERFTVC